MPTWIVTAAHRESGKPARLLIEASSAERAAEKADLDGYLVSGEPMSADHSQTVAAGADGDAALQQAKALRFEVTELRAEVVAIRGSRILRSPCWTIAWGVVFGMVLWAVICLVLWLLFVGLILGVMAGAAGAAGTKSKAGSAPSPWSTPSGR